MPLLDPQVTAKIGILQSLDDAIAFRLSRLNLPCPGLHRRSEVHRSCLRPGLDSGIPGQVRGSVQGRTRGHGPGRDRTDHAAR